MTSPPVRRWAAVPRVLLIGLGSIGRRHLRNLRALGCEVAVLRRREADAAATRADYGVEVFTRIEEASAWRPGFAVVSTPTSEHAVAASAAIDLGCHVLVEKPITSTREAATDLLAAAERQQRIVAVGCNLRFHPAILTIRAAVTGGPIGRLLTARAEVGQYLPDWHPDSDYRGEHGACAAMGGGATLMLIHELDYMMWIAGDVCDVTGRCAHVSDLEIDVADVTEIICRHTSGALTSVHMDFLDRAYNRRSRWIGECGSIEWTWGGPVRLLCGRDASETLWDEPAFDYNDTYVSELEDFISAASDGRPPRTPGRDALRTLEVALSVTNG